VKTAEGGKVFDVVIGSSVGVNRNYQLVNKRKFRKSPTNFLPLWM